MRNTRRYPPPPQEPPWPEQPPESRQQPPPERRRRPYPGPSPRQQPPGQGGRPYPGPPPGQDGRPYPGPPPGQGGRPYPGPPQGPAGRPYPGPSPGQGGRPYPGPPQGPGGRPYPGPPPGPADRPYPGPPPGPADRPYPGTPPGPADRPYPGPPAGPGRRPYPGAPRDAGYPGSPRDGRYPGAGDRLPPGPPPGTREADRTYPGPHRPPRKPPPWWLNVTRPQRLAPDRRRHGFDDRDSPASQVPARFDLRAVCAVLLITIAGLALVRQADGRAVQGASYDTSVYLLWAGLIAIFAPAATRVLMRRTGRAERLTLVLMLGVALYLVKIQGSPNAFTFFDEYIHLRNTQDILRTGHLFQHNPLLPTAAYYPGLAATAATIVSLTGLSTFAAGLITIGVARLLISACFYLIAEKVTGSSRGAGAASLIYAANPMFLFWSSSFAYEDL